jgi:DNA-directed RNA polymerase subunit RPC12/RpoP
MDKIPKLILTKPKLVIDVKCNKCKKMDIVALPYVEVQCKNCKTVQTTEANINIFYSISKKLEQLLANNNEVHIIGKRNDTKVYNSEDIAKVHDRNDDDILSAIEAIRNVKIKQKCWEVSDIMNEYDYEYKVSCKSCGICLSCVTCNKCSKTFTPKIVQTKNGTEKRYTCPHCGAKSYHQTRIKKFENNKCPHCQSTDVIFSTFEAYKRKCPRCGSEDICKPKRIAVYKLVIKRQKRFEQ